MLFFRAIASICLINFYVRSQRTDHMTDPYRGQTLTEGEHAAKATNISAAIDDMP